MPQIDITYTSLQPAPKIIPYKEIDPISAGIDKSAGYDPDIEINFDINDEMHIGPGEMDICEGWHIINGYNVPERQKSDGFKKVICTTNCHVSKSCRKLFIVDTYHTLDELKRDGFNIEVERPENIDTLYVSDGIILYAGYLDLSKFTNLKMLSIVMNVSKCDGVINAPSVEKLALHARMIEHNIKINVPKLQIADICPEHDIYKPIQLTYNDKNAFIYEGTREYHF